MIDVKRAFILADKLKDGPFSTRQAFLASFETLNKEVQALLPNSINAIVGKDPIRLRDYEKANWVCDEISLIECEVWPKMGGLAWAEGFVFEVASKFKRNEQYGKVFAMKPFVDVFACSLPIIVFRTSSGLRIDDGSHRAVAMALCNITRVTAWIGSKTGVS